MNDKTAILLSLMMATTMPMTLETIIRLSAFVFLSWLFTMDVQFNEIKIWKWRIKIESK